MKKIISILLCVMMVFTMMPGMALADTQTEDTQAEGTQTEGTETETTVGYYHYSFSDTITMMPGNGRGIGIDKAVYYYASEDAVPVECEVTDVQVVSGDTAAVTAMLNGNNMDINAHSPGTCVVRVTHKDNLGTGFVTKDITVVVRSYRWDWSVSTNDDIWEMFWGSGHTYTFDAWKIVYNPEGGSDRDNEATYTVSMDYTAPEGVLISRLSDGKSIEVKDNREIKADINIRVDFTVFETGNEDPVIQDYFYVDIVSSYYTLDVTVVNEALALNAETTVT